MVGLFGEMLEKISEKHPFNKYCVYWKFGLFGFVLDLYEKISCYSISLD